MTYPIRNWLLVTNSSVELAQNRSGGEWLLMTRSGVWLFVTISVYGESLELPNDGHTMGESNFSGVT